MRNITDAVHRRDHDRVKQGAHKIYLAQSLAEERQAFRHFQRDWQDVYTQAVKSLGKELPDLLNRYAFCKHLWKKLRTTNAIDSTSRKSDATPEPWWSFPASTTWTGLSMPSSTASTKIGEIAPASFLHTRLDGTPSEARVQR